MKIARKPGCPSFASIASFASVASLAFFSSACVPLVEPPLSKDSIAPGQKTVMIAFSCPGPLLFEGGSKLGTAVGVVPGLGLFVQSAQNERDLAASRELQSRLSRSWSPFQAFMSAAPDALKKTSHPGRWIMTDEAGLMPQDLVTLNQATDAVDWRTRYYPQGGEASGKMRDYASFAALNGLYETLVFEINLAYGLAVGEDAQGNQTAKPAVGLVARLIRPGADKPLWEDGESADDPSNVKTVAGHEADPRNLIKSWETLFPTLAQKLAASYNAALSGHVTLRPGAQEAAPPQPLPPSVSFPQPGAVAPSTGTAVVPTPSGPSPSGPAPTYPWTVPASTGTAPH